MTKLIIVESPTKARELTHFLGREYKVLASMGHVRDLPTKTMGIQPPKFIPEYEPTERGRGTLAGLRKAAKDADTIYLASDPDREGEAIAWHISDALNLPKKKTRRITYTEVTETAVKRALNNPRDIDMDLVAAQEARRVADRIIGYGVSPALCKAGNGRFSAGRTQTPALGLIVNREAEINAHTKTYHFTATLSVDVGNDAPAIAEWNRTPYLGKGEEYILDKELAEAASRPNQVSVIGQSVREKTTMPSAPFTTSSFQQACSNKLNISPDSAMRIAQTLFETGRITYMRTDSTNLADEAIENIREYAKSKGLPLPARANVFKTKSASAQEAHEAIRPTEMHDEGTNLSGDAARVYKMIHERTLVCQLAPMVEKVSSTVFRGEDEETGKTFEYRSTGYQTVSPGYTVVTGEPDKAELVNVSEGDICEVLDSEVKNLETKPKPRFTEATFLAELERLGIGRPSTFASILSTLYFRNYIEARGKALFPTTIGKSVFGALRQTKFAQVKYTSDMEETLDKISEGRAGYLDVVTAIYAESQRDADSIKSFTVPSSNDGRRSTGPARKSRPLGNNPNTKATGTKKRRVIPTANKTSSGNRTRKR